MPSQERVVATRSKRKTSPRAAGRTADVSLSDAAYGQMEEMITTLRLTPGQAVSEAYLSSTLGIGRTPVREALQRLARERLVVIHPRQGVVVSEINIKDQLKLLEFRRELERLIARVAARRSTADERKAMHEIAESMEKAATNNDEMLFMRLDRKFDALFVKLARNDFLSDALQPLQGLSRRFWYVNYKSAANMPQTAKLHADVARAIAKGDERAAMQASDNLVNYIEAFTKSTLTADF